VGPFGDCDGSPTKDLILNRRNEPEIAKYFRLCFEKRPAEELYDLKEDPEQVDNVAGRPEYAGAQGRLRSALERWRRETGDPRVKSDDDSWDRYPYFGAPAGRGTAG
jgi:hypothetical protein